MEADDFYSQNSVSDIIPAHLKLSSSSSSSSSEKYYPEHEDPQRQNMWIVNPFVEHKETALSHEETLQLITLYHIIYFHSVDLYRITKSIWIWK